MIESPETFSDSEGPGESTAFVIILDVLISLVQKKRMLFSITLTIAALSAGLVLLLPSKYTGTAQILIPQQSQPSAAMMLGQLGGGGGLASMAGSALGIKNQTDMYVSMIKSRSVSDAIISRFNLKEEFSSKTMVAARKKLSTKLQVTGGKDGIITIEFEHKSARIAANIANAYVEELDKMMRRLVVTEASRRRDYYERLLLQANGRLNSAEQAYRKVQEKSGLIQPDAQANVTIETIAKIKAEITAREVKIGAMTAFATENNPEMVRIKMEIEELNSKLHSLEDSSEQRRRGDIAIPAGQVPELALEVIRRTRELKYQEALYELLAKQYELARFDEAKDSASIQVIDKAIPMDYRSGPPKSAIFAILTIGGFIGSALCIVMSDRVKRRKRLGFVSKKIDLLRNAIAA